MLLPCRWRLGGGIILKLRRCWGEALHIIAAIVLHITAKGVMGRGDNETLFIDSRAHLTEFALHHDTLKRLHDKVGIEVITILHLTVKAKQ